MSEEDDFVRITLRLPKALHAQLTEEAAKKRSMNAEIIARLEESFPDPTRYDRLRLQALQSEKEGVFSQFEYMKERMAIVEEQIALLKKSLPDD